MTDKGFDDWVRRTVKEKSNFVFIGESGSGKSEIAINFAKYLAALNEKPVHIFDMDMTKPLFRSRDVKERMEELSINFHYQEQFFDAPTIVGGVNLMLKDENRFVVLDIGGNDVGARAIGGFASKLNLNNAAIFYVLNVYRPWSDHLSHIDETLSSILKSSHIQFDKLHIISNPNFGRTTTIQEVLEGNERLHAEIGSLIDIEFTCIKDQLYEGISTIAKTRWMPIHLYLDYPWNH